MNRVAPVVVVRVCSLGLLAALVGCTPNLTAAKVGTLQMSQTTEEQVKAMFGSPDRSQLLNASTGSSCFYAFNEQAQSPLPFVPTDRAYLVVELRDNRLNGYYFLTSRDKEATHLDEAAARQIKSGVSTRDDVIKLLGPPSGQVRVPSLFKEAMALTSPKTKEIWTYTSGDELKGQRMGASLRFLTVSFDADGRVQQYLLEDRKVNLYY